MTAKKKESLRLRFFRVLAKHEQVTFTQLYGLLGLKPGHGSVGVLVRSETKAGRVLGRLDVTGDGREVRYYRLSALGKRHLEEGKVDDYALAKRLDSVGRGKARVR